MRRKRSRKRASAGTLLVAYTDKAVSGWGGLVGIFRFFEKLGLREVLGQALPDGRTSPNQIPVVDMVWSLFAAVLTGASRFAHIERLRRDEVVRRVLGVQRIPSAMTLTRYFGGFVRGQVEHLSECLGEVWKRHLKPPEGGEILDLDSTIFERYGRQEGSRKGHNPRKPGRPCQRPLVAMLAHSKLILHAWLRAGNTGCAQGAEAFLDEAVARLPAGFRLTGVRADSGFATTKFLEALERHRLLYAVAVKLTSRVKRAILAISTWHEIEPGLEVGEGSYRAYRWKSPRRLVVIRQRLHQRPRAAGRLLFELPEYTFQVLLTNSPQAPEQLWRFYNGRGDCENRLKELKHDFRADGFCLRSFDGTEAVFRLICALFNLFVLFRDKVLRNSTQRLSTVRQQYFVVGGILGASGRHRILRLGFRGTWRRRFQGVLERVHSLSLFPVPGLPEAPSRWRPRSSPKPGLTGTWLPAS